MESLCIAIFTVVLAFPLAMQLHALIADPRRFKKIVDYCVKLSGRKGTAYQPEIFQYYPKESISFDAASDSRMVVPHLRTIFSSPALSSESTFRNVNHKIQALLPAPSSSYIKTDGIVPVLDISWNYHTYRYKAFETSLRNRYGENYPPGNVVMNSMQLNLLESTSRIARNVKSGIFDFTMENEGTLRCLLPGGMEIERFNPLDHFIQQRHEQILTEDKCTEMLKEKGNEEEDEMPQNARWTDTPVVSSIVERVKDASYENRRSKKTGEIINTTTHRKLNIGGSKSFGVRSNPTKFRK